MKIDQLKQGLPVVYMPSHAGRKIKDDQLGIVSSVNNKYAFVRYKGTQNSQATNPEDLYPLDNRPDLIERLGLEVKPINRVCELWLEEKKLFANLNSIN